MVASRRGAPQILSWREIALPGVDLEEARLFPFYGLQSTVYGLTVYGLSEESILSNTSEHRWRSRGTGPAAYGAVLRDPEVR